MGHITQRGFTIDYVNFHVNILTRIQFNGGAKNIPRVAKYFGFAFICPPKE
jgi:hypothetical protein